MAGMLLTWITTCLFLLIVISLSCPQVAQPMGPYNTEKKLGI